MSRKKMTWIALFVVAFGTAACSNDVAGPDFNVAADIEEQADQDLQDQIDALREAQRNRKRPN
jgi:hypothetical protein